MSIRKLNFEELTEADLASLIEAGVPEGMTIEYKEAPYGRSDADVKEFLKDVSSFANTVGGHLVIGIAESAGSASAIRPISGLDVDAEILRLENLMRDGLEPRITGSRIKAVAVAGGVVIAIRIPRSWNPPHRVAARNTNRFYVRNSAGSHEASVEELRTLFNLSANAMERSRSFRNERLIKLGSDEGPVILAQDLGLLLLHIVPLDSFAGLTKVDLDQAYQLHNLLRPMASTSYTPRINFEGVLNYRGGESCFGYTQLFRNGILEATKVRIAMKRDNTLIIPALDFDRHILQVLPGYLNALQQLEVPPPLIVTITLTGVKGSCLGVSNDQFVYDPPPPIPQAVLELPEVMIEDYGSDRDYQKAIRPAFDALWNTAGFSRSQYFDQSDAWVGPSR